MKRYRAKFIAPIAIASAVALGSVPLLSDTTQAADKPIYGAKTKKKMVYGPKKSDEKMKAAPYGTEKK
jgi:hypothetical protein